MTAKGPRLVMNRWLSTLPSLPAAACRDHPELDWFSEDAWEVRETVPICRTCPQRSECALFALKHPELPGVWGGLTAEQRNQLRGDRP